MGKLISSARVMAAGIMKRIYNLLFKKHRLHNIDHEIVFTDIFRKNKWGDGDSVSGTGSNLAQTEVVRRELRNLFNELKVVTLLDIPCGDFYWMSHIDMSKIKYIGADIVEDIVKKNTEKYTRDKIAFCRLNIIKDELPRSDIILCRDCLVHLSFKDIHLALGNICRSKSTYLLSTTFTDRKNNRDIFTGQWRPINLVLPPFNLPEPILIINEECTEGKGQYADKSLGLWRIDDIAARLRS